ncbi:hypothetical protein AUK45_03205 [Candidatus Peregrinibacteria bacterium CG2_30_44_17]|nr:MAG: hypothetical protein AUK45_03205 [Candidatus Peregrinibacteria bacterium CG2_30_44_17]
MTSLFLIKGFIVGFSVAAPVGPIGLLCISRTIEKGRMAGFVTGMGAATADTIYGFIAGFGLTLITGLLTSYSSLIQLIGGGFMLYLGIKTMATKTVIKKSDAIEGSLFRSYLEALLITVTSPMTIAIFTAVFASVGLSTTGGDYIDSSVLVIGVLLGSSTWWLLLSSVTAIFKSRIREKHLRLIDKGAGLLICGFGLVGAASAIF